jgi:CSLREA domain-containing protein
MSDACRRLIALIVGALVMGLAAATAPAATFTVNSVLDSADSAPGNGVCASAAGDCTLRAAIDEINANGAMGCGGTLPPLPDCGGSITLPAGAYTLTTGGVTITRLFQLIGAGPETTVIDGAGTTDTVLAVVGASAGAISGVTVRGGAAHGISTNTSTGLTLLNVAVVDHRGMGVVNTCCSFLSVSDSVVSNNGGSGILNLMTLIVRRSRIARNHDSGIVSGFESLVIEDSVIIGNSTPTSGGGIRTGGGLIARTIIRGNSAGLTGGGVYCSRPFANEFEALALPSGNCRVLDTTIAYNVAGTDGGGIYSTTGVGATNVTITGNRAGRDGGGAAFGGVGSHGLANVTVAQNVADDDHDGVGDGGGVSFGNGTAANSLIAGNSDSGGQAPDCAGTLNSAGYNLIQNTAGCTITGETSDVIGAAALLGPLQNNGGPTPTRALLPGSAAIDAGDPAGCIDIAGGSLSTDQRGFPRPRGPACDIGAYERTEQCRGKTATVFVEHGVVVGGPYDGLLYTGQLLGTNEADVILGTARRDKIDGRRGDDLVCGEDGRDVLSGGAGDDVLDGGSGTDQLAGGGGSDTCVNGEHLVSCEQ